MSAPLGLDTNVLARYYVGDDTDMQSASQREKARALIDGGHALAVCKTVLLELEWVMRGYYGFDPTEVHQVFVHLMAQPHIRVEDREAVERAVACLASGLDFADALHHASYADCKAMLTFDDLRFARRAKRLNLAPPVLLPR